MKCRERKREQTNKQIWKRKKIMREKKINISILTKKIIINQTLFISFFYTFIEKYIEKSSLKMIAWVSKGMRGNRFGILKTMTSLRGAIQMVFSSFSLDTKKSINYIARKFFVFFRFRFYDKSKHRCSDRITDQGFEYILLLSFFFCNGSNSQTSSCRSLLPVSLSTGFCECFRWCVQFLAGRKTIWAKHVMSEAIAKIWKHFLPPNHLYIWKNGYLWVTYSNHRELIQWVLFRHRGTYLSLRVKKTRITSMKTRKTS